MASLEAVCARLCLLTRYAIREEMPAPLSRASVQKMVRCGALEGLALRSVPGIREEYYARAKALLSRAAEVYAGIERARAQGYWIMLPEDDLWPVNLNALGAYMPQVLFVKGNRRLLFRRAVAVAGSRRIALETGSMSASFGRRLADEGLTLVCGGAQGVDMLVQQGALEHGGSLILVPAKPAEKLLNQDYLSRALEDGRLLMLCDTWPDEAFSTSKALGRNHTIYALGDAALTIASQNGVGGTWNGAIHCLKGGYTPLFAADCDGEDFAGNHELIRRGARPFYPDLSVGDQLFGKSEAEYDRRD